MTKLHISVSTARRASDRPYTRAAKHLRLIVTRYIMGRVGYREVLDAAEAFRREVVE